MIDSAFFARSRPVESLLGLLMRLTVLDLFHGADHAVFFGESGVGGGARNLAALELSFQRLPLVVELVLVLLREGPVSPGWSVLAIGGDNPRRMSSVISNDWPCHTCRTTPKHLFSVACASRSPSCARQWSRHISLST